MLGLSIGGRELAAVYVTGRRIKWFASALYGDTAELARTIARLAGEAPMRVRHVRVVLQRDIVQLRSIVPAPPLKPREAVRYVALETSRLFRVNGAAVVTDAVFVQAPQGRVLWAAAVEQSTLEAVVSGCEGAGLQIQSVGPASEVLAVALKPGGQTPVAFHGNFGTEVLALSEHGTWNSRLVRKAAGFEAPLIDSLQALQGNVLPVASAFGAAMRQSRFTLLPPDARLTRHRAAHRRLVRVMIAALLSWIVAGSVYTAKLAGVAARADAEFTAIEPELNQALDVRREFHLASEALRKIRITESRRSNVLVRIADVTRALGDSTFVTALHLSQDSLRLSGYAPVAVKVLADLEIVDWLRDARLVGPPVRQVLNTQSAGQERDRFTVTAGVRRGR
jgi:hypothetical protein